MQGQNIGFAGWMIVAGMGIPITAMVAGGLGARIGSASAASSISLAVSMSVAIIVATAIGLPGKAEFSNAPLPYYFGGVFMAFYLLSIAFVAPRFGLANAIVCVLFGQIVSAAIIDHFGLFGAERTQIDVMRMGGLAVMGIGIWMAQKPAPG